MRHLLSLLCLLVALPAAGEERHFGDDVNASAVLHFKLPDAAVRGLLPAGWEPNPPASGALQGYNLAVSLIDTLAAHDPDGKPVPSGPVVVLSVPAKRSGSEEGGAMLVDGFAPPALAPGPYGLYRPATIVMDRRSHADDSGKSVGRETWEVKAEDGAYLAIRLQFERGAPARGKVEAKIYSANRAGFYRLERVDRTLDVVRSIPAGVDRLRKYEFHATGAKLAPLFEGAAELVNVTAIPFQARSIHQPTM